MNIKNYKYKLFGRLKGRRKRDKSFINSLDRYIIDTKKLINKTQFNILDIGSGSGENSIYLAKNDFKSKIIACEVFQDGNINLTQNIIKENITNISIFQGNVLEFLDESNQIEVFNEIWILFPDPWPKIRHNKRRLINNLFFQKIYSFLKKSGKLMIASDSRPYIHSITRTIYESQDIFFWENQMFDQWNYKYLNLPITKFYRKALKSNRNSMFFKLIKI